MDRKVALTWNNNKKTIQDFSRFLNIPAFLIFFPITAFMARLGAKASHKIDKNKMTKYFGWFLIVIGSKFLYEYFNL